MNRKERRKQRSGTERAGAGSAPSTPEALFRAAFEYHRVGRLKEARALYQRALAGQPDNPELLHFAGLSAYEDDDLDTAIQLMTKAIQRRNQRPEVYNNLGNALQKSGLAVEAEAAFRESLLLAPGYADAHYNLGNLLREMGRPNEAIAEYDWALKTQPNDPQIHHNRGMVLQTLGQREEAVAAYRNAIVMKPDYVDALLDLGSLLHVHGQSKDAIGYLRRVVVLDPNNMQALILLGAALDETGVREEALIFFRKALAVDPSNPNASAGYLRMLEFTCAWDEAARFRAVVREATLDALAKGKRPAEGPFEAAHRVMDNAYLLRVARAHSDFLTTTAAVVREGVAAAPKPSRDGRITIGYVSSDFRNHAVGQLIHALFALHDRAAFRVHAYSTRAADDSVYRRRIKAGCEKFVDLQGEGAIQAARRIRQDGVDILVDLNGHTAWNRLDVLALRPAPVQVTYLGYPGTTGANFIDYVLADAMIVPPEHASFFTERVVYLPGCYMVNSPHPIAERPPSRTDCRLPDDAFVFCSFARNNKVEPVMFGVWMEILHRVPGSVLWLPSCNPTAKGHLRQEAEVYGIAAPRLIFADRVDAKEDHLARSRLADLALDTRIFGGHTTTSDMLWAGVPVITLLGAHFASRVGASLLKAIGLEELVTNSLEEYRDLAVRLAQDPAALDRLRQRLAASHEHSPLFDTARFARNLERAFAEMWARHIGGLEPASITVADD